MILIIDNRSLTSEAYTLINPSKKSMSMTEQAITTALETAKLGSDLVYQVSLKDSSLKIMINRPDPAPLDYPAISAQILTLLKNLALPDLQSVDLYCRALGETKPDWKTQLTLNPSNQPSSSESANRKDITLYTFGISDYLLTTSLPDPDADIADIVIFFHQLSLDQKYHVLPSLEQVLRQPTQSIRVELPPATAEWLERIRALKEQKLKSASIWLSRYCVKGESALAQVQSTLKATAEAKKAIASEISKPVTRTLSSVSAKPPTNSQSSKSPIRIFIPVALLAGVVGGGWFVSQFFQNKAAKTSPTDTPPTVTVPTPGAVTALHQAAGSGNLEEVRKLLPGSKDINARDPIGSTALHWGASGCIVSTFGGGSKTECNGSPNQTPIAEVLIAAGADVNARDEDEETPLHWAYRTRNQEVINFLISKGADPNAKNSDGELPGQF